MYELITRGGNWKDLIILPAKRLKDDDCLMNLRIPFIYRKDRDLLLRKIKKFWKVEGIFKSQKIILYVFPADLEDKFEFQVVASQLISKLVEFGFILISINKK